MSIAERLKATDSLLRTWWATVWQVALHFPWRNTAITLRERFREDRLGVTASSLTFTTTISLVPLFTVGLAVFSAFPMFDRLQVTLQRWLVQSLVPDNIARQVLMYLNQFVNKAQQMGWAGALFLLFTSLALILTIDRKLNDIWRVRQARPLTQRVLVYWAVLTLGPLLLAGSVAATSYALTLSRSVSGSFTGTVRLLLDSLQFVIGLAGLAALYRYVPNTHVRWAHAITGGVFAAAGLELAKTLLAWYLAEVPTYSTLYGTFAAVPILLVWFYVAWVIVLLGAVVTAYLPSLLTGVARRGDSPGWGFQLALEVMEALQAMRHEPGRGLSLGALAQRLRVDVLQLEEPVAAMVALDWVARLDEDGERYVLLIDPALIRITPLVERLLLARAPGTEAFWAHSGLTDMTVAQAIAAKVAEPPAPPLAHLG